MTTSVDQLIAEAFKISTSAETTKKRWNMTKKLLDEFGADVDDCLETLKDPKSLFVWIDNKYAKSPVATKKASLQYFVCILDTPFARGLIGDDVFEIYRQKFLNCKTNLA